MSAPVSPPHSPELTHHRRVHIDGSDDAKMHIDDATTTAVHAATATVAVTSSTHPRKRKQMSDDHCSSSAAQSSSTAAVATSTSSSTTPSKLAPRYDRAAAAAKIQALVRGRHARAAHKHSLLMRSWSELDWREERQLMSSNDAYVALKKFVSERKKTDAVEAKAAEKKMKKIAAVKALTAEEEEVAAGLPLRDGDSLTLPWVLGLMDYVKTKKLPLSIIMKLIERVIPIFKGAPNVVEASINGRLICVGDLHGQLDDLLEIFRQVGEPSGRNRFVFNGDIVDRGQNSIECIATLLAWKVLYPDDVFINRGNHEARDLNGRDGFEEECHRKYGRSGTKLFDAFSTMFSNLPLATLIERQVFVVHGGLSDRIFTIDEVNRINRFEDIPPSDSLFEHLLWSDPKASAHKGKTEESPRGAGVLFAASVTKEFFAANKPIHLIVRSHECEPKGYLWHHHDQLITVFSASNYTGTVGNDGALLMFEKESEPAAAAEANASTNSSSATATTPNRHSHRASSPALGVSTHTHSHTHLKDTPPSIPSARPRSPRPAALNAAAATKAMLLGESAMNAAFAATLPKLKHTIITYYAGRKEKQPAFRLNSTTDKLANSVVAKLIHLISGNRLQLIDWYRARATQHSTGVSVVTRQVWAQGLKEVLKLKTVPFAEFSDLLGLPRLGVDGKNKGVIDYCAWLIRYRPINLLVNTGDKETLIRRSQSSAARLKKLGLPPSPLAPLETSTPIIVTPSPSSPSVDATSSPTAPSSSPMSVDGSTSSPSSSPDTPLDSMQSILDLLHRQKVELESLFRLFDTDGNGSLTREEFREGIESLQKQLKAPLTTEQIDSLIERIDRNRDGNISIAEFFDSFELADAQLAEHQRRAKEHHEQRNRDHCEGEGEGESGAEAEGAEEVLEATQLQEEEEPPLTDTDTEYTEYVKEKGKEKEKGDEEKMDTCVDSSNDHTRAHIHCPPHSPPHRPRSHSPPRSQKYTHGHAHTHTHTHDASAESAASVVPHSPSHSHTDSDDADAAAAVDAPPSKKRRTST